MVDHKNCLFIMMVQLFRGDSRNKSYQQLHLIMNKFLELHEASRECVWLRSRIQHTQKTCGLTSEKLNRTTIYKDNIGCITQLKDGYIKGDRIKTYFFKLPFHS